VVTEEQVRETVDCCLATLDRYHDAERRSDARAIMAAEVAVAVGWLSEWGLSLGEAVDLIAVPVGETLVSRYGHEVGRRLDSEFMGAFELALADARQSDFAGTHERMLAPGRPGPTGSDGGGARTSPWT